MLCRVEMPANEQIFGRYYRWRYMHADGKSKIAPGIILCIVLVVVGAMSLLLGMRPWLLVIVLGVMGVYFLYTLWLRPNQLFRKKEAAALQVEITIFTKDGYARSVKSEEGGLPDNASARYDTLVRAVETNRDFYLFTAPNKAFYIDKEYFTKGSPEELRQILREKLGKKFKGKSS